MSPVVEVVFVWVPIVAAVVFVAHFGLRCLREGTSLARLPIDRRFLMVFLYTGALLAIYLSTFHFFYTGLT